MTGRRLPDGPREGRVLAPGDYFRDAEGRWWAKPPRGRLGALDDHAISEHPDGTITVTPSIVDQAPTGGHWLLDHGVWREV